MTTKPVLIAGPTASGKSRLALEIARRTGGVIVNADSMQVYGELRILTARPSQADEKVVPHRLYGHVPAAVRYSVGRWLDDMAAILAALTEEGRVPIVVGGTGLYFKALTEGLAQIPPVPAEIRRAVLENADGVTSDALHRQLADIDPADAAAIRPSDRARILRALEVFAATGRSLVAWRAGPATPLLDPARADCIIVEPERPILHQRIAERAEAMIRAGAQAEADALAALGLSPDLPAMKAIGVRQLIDHRAGRLSLDEALAAIKTETRRYAKRQMTWFRHQMAGWRRIPT